MTITTSSVILNGTNQFGTENIANSSITNTKTSFEMWFNPSSLPGTGAVMTLIVKDSAVGIYLSEANGSTTIIIYNFANSVFNFGVNYPF